MFVNTSLLMLLWNSMYSWLILHHACESNPVLNVTTFYLIFLLKFYHVLSYIRVYHVKVIYYTQYYFTFFYYVLVF